MTRFAGLIVVLTTALALPAVAAPEHSRIRGTVQSVDMGSVTVQTTAGKQVTIALAPETKYANLVKSSLTNVSKDSFIGTATKGSGDFLVALEVSIFPPSMRGTGEGHYAWDRLPDTTMSSSQSAMTSMTNGTVTTEARIAPAGDVNSAMTNGNVESETDQGGAKRITVTYKGGQKTILVPPTAPVVAFQPSDASSIVKGAHVFVRTTDDAGKVTADFVAIGQNGLVPPM